MLSPKDQKKLERLAKIAEGGSLGVFEYLVELEESFEAKAEEMKLEFEKKIQEYKSGLPDIAEILKSVKGQDGITPEKGKDYFDGEDGKDYVLTDKDKKEIAKSVVVPIVEKVIERTEVIKEQPIINNEIKEVAVFDERMIEEKIPQMGERIRDALELLQGDERLDKSAIKGLEEELRRIGGQGTQIIGGGIIGRDLIKDIDLSDQLDGVTKTFNIQGIWNVISVSLTSYPYGALRKNIDYTWTPTSITFTSTIDASTQLSVGQQCILTVVQS